MNDILKGVGVCKIEDCFSQNWYYITPPGLFKRLTRVNRISGVPLVDPEKQSLAVGLEAMGELNCSVTHFKLFPSVVKANKKKKIFHLLNKSLMITFSLG